MRFALLITAFLVVVAAGCKSSALSQQQPTKPAILSGNDTDVRERLLTEIPIGTTLAQAERIMQGHGFRCYKETNDKTNEPYLWCRYSHMSDVWVEWTWNIMIHCPGGFVSEIQCSQYGTGL